MGDSCDIAQLCAPPSLHRAQGTGGEFSSEIDFDSMHTWLG